MKLTQIYQLKDIYELFLSVNSVHQRCEEEYKKLFLLEEDNKYNNPFYNAWDFEKSLKDVRDRVLRDIEKIFNKEYPNVQVEGLDKFIEEITNEYGHSEKTLKINFHGIVEFLVSLENNRDELAVKKLVKEALHLIPSEYTGSYNDKKKFKAEDIVKHGKLALYCGWGYSSANTSHISELKKIINIVLNNEPPSTAQEIENGFYIKYFKNGRCDIELSKDGALKVAKYLEERQ